MPLSDQIASMPKTWLFDDNKNDAKTKKLKYGSASKQVELKYGNTSKQICKRMAKNEKVVCDSKPPDGDACLSDVSALVSAIEIR